jgi:hypothetical protein
VTAPNSWPSSVDETEPRSIIRSQHLLYRGRPTGSERQTLSKDCGWKDGDRGGSVNEVRIHRERKSKTVLTQAGLLMEGVENFPDRLVVRRRRPSKKETVSMPSRVIWRFPWPVSSKNVFTTVQISSLSLANLASAVEFWSRRQLV